MLSIKTSREARKAARVIERALSAYGREVPLGSALDALARAAGFQDWNGWSALLKEQDDCAPVKKAPARISVLQVPFDQIVNIVVEDAPFMVTNVSPEGLAGLRRLFELADCNADEREDLEGLEVLTITWLEEDLVHYGPITAGELHELKWNAEFEGFMSPSGRPWKFYLEQAWHPYAEKPSLCNDAH